MLHTSRCYLQRLTPTGQKLTQAREGLMTEHAMGEAVDLLVELARRNGEGRIPIGDAIFSRARSGYVRGCCAGRTE